MDIETYALARAYTDKEVAGGGAIKGKNCVITEIEEITGGHIVHFQWTLDDGTVETDTMTVMNGEDGTQVSASETNGNIILDGTETQVYDDSEIKGELSTDTTTIEGNPLNFSTLSAQNAESIIIDLEPIQDLHGYPNPWVGGAGKNKLPLTVDSLKALNTGGTWSGNTFSFRDYLFTLLTDNDNNIYGIKVTGSSSSANVYFKLTDNTFTTEVGDRLTGCPKNGSSTTYGLGQSGSGGKWDYGNGNVFTASVTNNISIWLNQYAISTELIFYPMLEANRGTSSFEPYTNIASISGRTEIGILGCGKNLLPNKIAQSGTYNVVFGQDNNDNFEIPLKSNTTYAFSYQTTVSNPITMYIREENASSAINLGTNNPCIFTIAQDGNYRIVGNSTTAIIPSNFSNCMLEKDNQATTYEPYTKSNNLTISFGQTVYGGQLDVENGVLTLDEKYLEFDGTEDDWSAGSATGRYVYPLNDGRISSSTVIQYSNHYTIGTSGNDYAVYGNAYSQGTKVRVGFNTVIYETLADWKTYLTAQNTAGNPVSIVYKLATPITINLTPNTINLLKGVNNISTDGDKITLTYRDGSVATLEDVKLASEDLEQQIADAQILTDTVTGDKYKLVITNGVLDIQQISNEQIQTLSMPSPSLNLQPQVIEPEEEPIEEPSEEIPTENTEDEER